MNNTLPATLAWNGSTLRLLDQTRLPVAEEYLEITTVAALQDAILRLCVRGAPAIGCAGAFGTVFCAREADAGRPDAGTWQARFEAACEGLAETRPTAVNLRWAVERCKKLAIRMNAEGAARAAIVAELTREASAIQSEDERMCAAIGSHGAAFLERLLDGKKSAVLMTHCNAGALATAGSGTALAVMYAAAARGIKLRVFADETRPLLQGARLTAWELSKSGIETTVICDNMAAAVMREFKPDAVIVGADRIAANGDAANKIGTYGLAIVAKHHGVPFLIAAPSSTFDVTLARGELIPIEQRKREEVARPYGTLTVPDEAGVFNPAFDVTPAGLIAAHVTEKGVFTAPYDFAGIQG